MYDYEEEEEYTRREVVKESFVVDYELRRKMNKEHAIEMLESMIREIQKDDDQIILFQDLDYRKGLTEDMSYKAYKLTIRFKKIDKAQQQFYISQES